MVDILSSEPPKKAVEVVKFAIDLMRSKTVQELLPNVEKKSTSNYWNNQNYPAERDNTYIQQKQLKTLPVVTQKIPSLIQGK